MNDITRLLSAAEQGDAQASAQLLPLIYEELRQLAAQRLRHEKPGQTLQATALVHEAYLRLVGGAQEQHWNGRGHFFAAAAEAMRRILVERARHKKRLKQGGDRQREDLEQLDIAAEADHERLLDLNDALERLDVFDARAATVVKLRHFVGLTIAQTAEALGVSPQTVNRDWDYARTWLYRQLQPDAGTSPEKMA